MSAEKMITFLSNCSLEQQLGLRVATQCAPVLKGIKASNLITVKPGVYHMIRNCLKGSRIICVPLYADSKHEVLFLYRYDLLELLLKKENVRRFLMECGYDSVNLARVMVRLRQNYQKYAGGKQGFPHELGVLLGYPVEDVRGFIDNEGKNFLAKRYWKVYHNQEQAERIFRLYDKARETAMEEIMAGYPLNRVAVS